MRLGTYEHLMFQDGEIAFKIFITAQKEANHTGLRHIELSHHSRNAVETARAAYQFLQEMRSLQS